MNEDIASTLRLLDEALARYIRPDTFPLAIRMLKPGEAIPEDVKVPSNHTRSISSLRRTLHRRENYTGTELVIASRSERPKVPRVSPHSRRQDRNQFFSAKLLRF